MPPATSRVIVVLGMHRSGTSVLTHGLQALGVSLGDRLSPPGTDNPRGFWEDVDCLDLNERLLRHLGSAYDHLDMAWTFAEPDPGIDRLQGEAVELIAGRLHDHPGPWGFKDPRTCRLLGFWQPAIAAAGATMDCVLAVRNPLSVVRSLQHRDGLAPAEGYLLWLQHMVPALLGSHGADARLVVDFDLMMDHPQLQLHRLAAALDLPEAASPVALAGFTDAFLDDALRHTRFSIGELASDADAPGSAMLLYNLLLAMASDRLDMTDGDALDHFEDVRDRLADFNPCFRHLSDMRAERKSMLSAAAETARRLSTAADTMRQVREQADKAAADAHQAAKLAMEHFAVERRRAETAETAAAELRARLSAVSDQRDRAQGRLQAIEASTTWRATFLLRAALIRYPGLARAARRAARLAWRAVTAASRRQPPEPAARPQRAAPLAAPAPEPASGASIWFDANWYAAQYDAASDRLYADFVTHGAAAGRLPSGLVQHIMHTLAPQTAFTRAIHDRFVAVERVWDGRIQANSLWLLPRLFVPEWHVGTGSPLDKFLAYLRDGLPVGVRPGPLFDDAIYRRRAEAAALPPLAADANAVLHWLSHGAASRIVPTDRFDEAFYLATNPDVAEAKLWGFEHFISNGVFEGRLPTRHLSFRRDAIFASRHADGADLPEWYQRWLAVDFASGSGATAGDHHEKAALDARLEAALQAFLADAERLRVPQAGQPRVSIVIALFNQAHYTLECLRQILAQAIAVQVILVDNGSSDATSALLERLDGVDILRNPENLGFLRAVNAGSAQAAGDSILLLNNDAFMREGCLNAALETLGSAPDVGVVVGRLVLPTGALQEAGSIIWADGGTLGYERGIDPQAGEAMFRRDVDYGSGAFLLTWRALFERLGGLDPRYQPAYFEETDFCLRAWEAGMRVVYEPRAVIDHVEFGSETAERPATALMHHNQTVFRMRHAATLRARHLPRAEANLIFARMRGEARGRLLVIDNEVPLAHLGAGFPRAGAMLREAVAAGWFVSHYPLYGPQVDFTAAYGELPATLEICSGRGTAWLSGFLAERRGYYDAILVSRPDNMRVLRAAVAHQNWVLSGTRLIYDAEAVFAVRDALRAEIEGEVADPSAIGQEIALAAGVESVIAVSEGEAALFRARLSVPVRVLSNPMRNAVDPPGFSGRDGFLFVGRLLEKEAPNYAGLAWFIAEAWPRVRAALPDATLTVAGALADDPRELEHDGVRLLGIVADLAPLYDNARVFLSAVRFAAGLPTKILEAAAAGLPVVATPLMAQQLGWGDEAIATGDTPEALAEAAIRLYGDAASWAAIQRTAQDLVQRDHDAGRFRRVLREALEGGHAPRDTP